MNSVKGLKNYSSCNEGALRIDTYASDGFRVRFEHLEQNQIELKI
jgi:hypothetical protein